MNKTKPKIYSQKKEIEPQIILRNRLHRSHIIKKIFETVLFVMIGMGGAASTHASDITVESVRSQINFQREVRGIKPLRDDTRLDRASLNKSNDMIAKDYFEHYAYGMTPWKFITDQNYNYLYAGENLAMDFQTPEGMVRAWMNSPSHRKNILNPDFDDMGIGIVKGEYSDSKGSHQTIIVTNMFGKEKPVILQVIDSLVTKLKLLF